VSLALSQFRGRVFLGLDVSVACTGLAAVDAGVGTVMCSFNRINNTYSCEQGDSLAGWLLAPESAGGLGFDGAVVSDWTATHSTAASALAGLSVEQEWQRNASFYGANLSAAVAAGAQ
jgi:beta-glucosidase